MTATNLLLAESLDEDFLKDCDLANFLVQQNKDSRSH